MIDFSLFWFSFTDRFFHAPKLERETTHEQQRKVDILKMALSINEESTIQIVVSHRVPNFMILINLSAYAENRTEELISLNSRKKTSTEYYKP